jgi:hypothetical protein
LPAIWCYAYAYSDANRYAITDASGNTDTKNSSKAEESTDAAATPVASTDEKEGHCSIRFP